MSASRGRCPVCRRSCRLRKDGMLGAHRQAGPDCEGSGGAPVSYDPSRCGGCLEFRFMTPGLAEACASVGIEHGRDGGAVLYDVLAEYRRNGHKEPA